MKPPSNYPFTISTDFGEIHFVDLYQISTITDKSLTVDDITVRFFSIKLPFIDNLVRLRNILVRPFGLKTDFDVPQKSIYIKKYGVGESLVYFPVVSRTDNEIVLEENDKHLLFRIYCSVQYNNKENAVYSISTVVHFNNRWGSLYFFFVKPFHKCIVALSLQKLKRQLC